MEIRRFGVVELSFWDMWRCMAFVVMCLLDGINCLLHCWQIGNVYGD